MINITDKTKCSGCAACYNICPQKCIEMRLDNEGFLYPQVIGGCVDCKMCETVCPFQEVEKVNSFNYAFAAYSNNSDIRERSSSGGIFSMLAEEIKKEDGTIFGAAFSADWRKVLHMCNDDITLFQSSKYVQSEIGKAFQIVLEHLNNNEKVLFSGTPCQIAGLKNYLQKDYHNLICVDVICHGVPTPTLWAKYVDYLELKRGAGITELNFRNKKNGWEDFNLYSMQGKKRYFTSHHKDPYMQMFLSNYSLRPSCYSCNLKIIGSKADITLGDLWGAGQIVPELNDNKGLSAVIVHTDKGKQIIDRLDNCTLKKIDYALVSHYNSPLYKSVKKPEGREAFFEDLRSITISQLIRKYGKPQLSLKQRLARTSAYKRIRPLIHKVFIFNK